jgi:hypothetical protein
MRCLMNLILCAAAAFVAPQTDDRLERVAREPHVIGDRVLARLAAKAPSANAQMAALRSDLVETIRQLLVGTCTSLEPCREKLVAVARRHLNAAEVTAFAAAMEAEYRAIESAR